jgi:hypothetical protein
VTIAVITLGRFGVSSYIQAQKAPATGAVQAAFDDVATEAI